MKQSVQPVERECKMGQHRSCTFLGLRRPNTLGGCMQWAESSDKNVPWARLSCGAVAGASLTSTMHISNPDSPHGTDLITVVLPST